MAKKLTGTVSQVIGPVIDVHFPAGRLPAINNALTVPIGNKTLTVEVAQHIGGNTVRCIAGTHNVNKKGFNNLRSGGLCTCG